MSMTDLVNVWANSTKVVQEKEELAMHRDPSLCHEVLNAIACAKFQSLLSDCLTIGQSLLRYMVAEVGCGYT